MFVYCQAMGKEFNRINLDSENLFIRIHWWMTIIVYFPWALFALRLKRANIANILLIRCHYYLSLPFLLLFYCAVVRATTWKGKMTNNMNLKKTTYFSLMFLSSINFRLSLTKRFEYFVSNGNCRKLMARVCACTNGTIFETLAG